MPKIVKMPKPKSVRDAEKQRVRTLYCAGESLADAAKAVGVTYEAAKQWSCREGWTQEIQEAKALVHSMSPNVTIDQRIAFDRAKTGKETRNSLSRTSLRVAEFMETQPVEMIFASGKNFASHVQSAKAIDGTWEDSGANKFAVSLNLNTLVSNGQVRELEEGETFEVEP